MTNYYLLVNVWCDDDASLFHFFEIVKAFLVLLSLEVILNNYGEYVSPSNRLLYIGLNLHYELPPIRIASMTQSFAVDSTRLNHEAI